MTFVEAKVGWRTSSPASFCPMCDDTGGVLALLRANSLAEYSFVCQCSAGDSLDVEGIRWDHNRHEKFFVPMTKAILTSVGLYRAQVYLRSFPSASTEEVARGA